MMMTYDPPRGQANLPALEKNSTNFLESARHPVMNKYLVLLVRRYARMQYQSLSGSSLYLAFDDVVPKASSTTHVAAAALYHCLGKPSTSQLQHYISFDRIHLIHFFAV